MHVNRQVREAAAAALASTSLQSISSNRAIDLLETDLPAGVVGTSIDTVERWNKGVGKGKDPEDLRTIELTVSVVARGDSETLDDDLDALRAQIEPVVYSALAPLSALPVQHTGGELDMLADEEGSRWFAVLELTWEIRIATELGDPEFLLVTT